MSHNEVVFTEEKAKRRVQRGQIRGSTAPGKPGKEQGKRKETTEIKFDVRRWGVRIWRCRPHGAGWLISVCEISEVQTRQCECSAG